jgi:uncharacterized membrane protein YhaH (DUF805 family)
MREILIHFLSFEALNLIPEVYFALAGIWLLIVCITIASIFSQRIHSLTKLFWAAVVVAIPLAGAFFYTIFCLIRADYSYFQQMGLFLPANKGK